MEKKHKFFILGTILGFVIPFVEHGVESNTLEPITIIGKILVFGGAIWQYVFLYIIVLVSLLLYVRKLRERINPNSRLVFLVSGVSLGFALISIISATIHPFT